MASRLVSVTLSANSGPFISAMGSAASAAESAAGRMMRSAGRNSAEWNTVAGTLTKVGAVAAAGLGLAAKAAIDWESSFAGVKKTVDGTPQQIAALEGELRGMARTMATSHKDIAAVAEAAGALGVATPDVADFTRTMVMLGETTNLSATEAADSLAQFMNVMGTAPDQVDNLGSALVALGNNGASTERDIVQMSQRIAGAAVQIGMSEAETMGFASALSSVGIEAEAGGTAISTSFFKMEQAVRNGGSELETFASVAGMTTSQFKTAFEQDAAGAVTAFIEGLGRVGAAGGDVTGILKELGITGIREADALRRLASAGDLLRNSLSTASTAMTENQALMNEYAQRANTTESKVRVAWNNIVDAAITAGQAMLPVIATAAQGIASLAQSFGSLDPAVLKTGAAITAAVAVFGLIGGGAMKAIVALAELRAALSALGVTSALSGPMGALGGAIGRIATVAAPAALALLTLGIAIQALRADALIGDMQQAEIAIRNVANSAPGATRALDDFFKTTANGNTGQIAGDVDTLATAIRRFADPGVAEQIANVAEQIVTLGAADSQMERVNQQFGKMDQALANIATSGNLSQAQEAFARIRQEWEAQGHSVDTLLPRFGSYRASLEQTAQTLGVHNLSAQEMADWMGGRVPAAVQAAADAQRNAAGAAGEAAASLDQVGQAARQAAEGYLALANAQLQLSGSQMGVEAAIDAATAALQENGRTLDITSEKGRNNQAALDAIAGSALKLAQSQAEAGASSVEIGSAMDRNRASFISAAEAMGMSSSEAVALADRYGLVSAQASALGSTSQQAAGGMQVAAGAAAGLAQSLAAVPDGKQITVTAPGVPETKLSVDGLRAAIQGVPDDKMVTVTLANGEKVTATAGEVRRAIDGIPAAKTSALNANASGAVAGANTAKQNINSVNGKTVQVGADPTGAVSGSNTAKRSVKSVNGKTVQVVADPARAVAGSRTAQGSVNSVRGKTVEITTRANTAGANAARAAVNSVSSKVVTITTVHRTIRVVSDGGTGGGITRADGGLVPAYAGPTPAGFAHAQHLAVGGRVRGYSSNPKADNVPIWGTAGEIMMSNAAGDYYGRRGLLALNSRLINQRDFAAFMAAQGYADGGEIAPAKPWQSRTATPAVTQYVTAGKASAVDSGEIARAVASAVSNMRVVTHIGGREFYGAMRESQLRYGGRA